MFWGKSKKRTENTDQNLAAKVISFFRKAARGDYYTFTFLVDNVRPASPERLAAVLAELVSRKEIDRIVRVESRRGGGIGDYDSIANIPLEIYDRRTDDTFEVEPSDIQILFSPHVEGRVMEHSTAD